MPQKDVHLKRQWFNVHDICSLTYWNDVAVGQLINWQWSWNAWSRHSFADKPVSSFTRKAFISAHMAISQWELKCSTVPALLRRCICTPLYLPELTWRTVWSLICAENCVYGSEKCYVNCPSRQMEFLQVFGEVCKCWRIWSFLWQCRRYWGTDI